MKRKLIMVVEEDLANQLKLHERILKFLLTRHTIYPFGLNVEKAKDYLKEFK